MEKKYYSVCLENGNCYFDNIFSDNPYFKQEFRKCNIYAESIDDSEVLKDVITDELIYPSGSNKDLEYISRKGVIPEIVKAELNKFKNSTDDKDICLERYKNAINNIKSKNIDEDNRKGRC